MLQKNKLSIQTVGILSTIGAYTAWGSLPIYWKSLKMISATEILAHRIFWSFVFVGLLLIFKRRLGSLPEVIKDRSKRTGAFFSGILLTSNWFIYIWAVNNNMVVEASLGYYINPLFTVLMGMLVLRERHDKWQLASLSLATIGVLILTLDYGKFPWVALSLALTFALYSLAKKLVNVESSVGLALETLVVLPLALAYIVMVQLGGNGTIGHISTFALVLLICSGIVTSIPLIWFAQGAKSVPFTTIGFIQYISPTIMLILGVFVYKESFTSVHALSFGFIWGAIALYSLSRPHISKALQVKQANLLNEK